MKTPKELEEAVKSYQNGDRESFNRIYELSYRYLYTCIVRVMKNEDAAMDMIQETYLEISRNIDQLNQTENFLSWAAMIGNRKCFAYLKKNNRMILLDSDEGEGDSDYFENIADDECFIPESILQDREKQRLMREIIDGLSDMQRLCVIGYYYNEEKQEQIAEELGIPVNTVKSHLSRAKVNIKKGVLELEEKKGTRIYSLAPFMLLFFRREMADCVFKPMPEGLRAQLEDNRMSGSSGTDGSEKGIRQTGEERTVAEAETVSEAAGTVSGSSVLGKLAGASLKMKVLVGAVAAAGVIAGVSAAAVNLNRQEPETETAAMQSSAETAQETQSIVTGETAAAASSDSENASETAMRQTEETETATEETAGEEAAEYGQLAISGQYDEMKNARDGIAIVCRNGKWGLVSYDNEILVPLEYDYACSEPNDDGQTFFGKDGDYRVFDREGNEIFQTDKPVKAVSEGVVLWEDADEEAYTNDFAYVRLDGSVLYKSEADLVYEQSGAVGFNEGYAICADDYEIRLSLDGEAFDIFDARYPLRHPELQDPVQPEPSDSGIIVESSADSSDVDFFYPIGSVYKGYYVSRGMPFEDMYGDFYIYNTSGTEAYKFRMRNLVEYAGLSWEDPDLSWTIWGFWENGNLCFSNGTMISVSLESGGETVYYLIDVAAQDIITDEFGSEEPVISEECILASADYVRIDESGYWLIQQDGRWGYVDHDGTVMAMYDDASRFANGRAMVVEDGYACFIDENLEPLGERVPAQSVAAYGDIFAVTTPEGEQLCFESSTPPAVKGASEETAETGE